MNKQFRNYAKHCGTVLQAFPWGALVLFGMTDFLPHPIKWLMYFPGLRSYYTAVSFHFLSVNSLLADSDNSDCDPFLFILDGLSKSLVNPRQNVSVVIFGDRWLWQMSRNDVNSNCFTTVACKLVKRQVVWCERSHVMNAFSDVRGFLGIPKNFWSLLGARIWTRMFDGVRLPHVSDRGWVWDGDFFSHLESTQVFDWRTGFEHGFWFSAQALDMDFLLANWYYMPVSIAANFHSDQYGGLGTSFCLA